MARAICPKAFRASLSIRGQTVNVQRLLAQLPRFLAAALCIKRWIMPRELKVAELQEALRADGVGLTIGARAGRGHRGPEGMKPHR